MISIKAAALRAEDGKRPSGIQMTTFAFLSAVLALLATPGPTNTLLAVAGAAEGIVRPLRLIPVEMAAYFAVVVPLAVVGAPLLETLPAIATLLRVAAAMWVMALAVRMWRLDPSASGGAVTARGLFVTTLLNPKTLVIGLVLLPAPAAPSFALHLALFAGLLPLIATMWIAAGALVTARRSGTALPRFVRRCAACWLAIVSVGLAIGALHA
jgi:threonine/homoserine/homoserine lactone efflux protein